MPISSQESQINADPDQKQSPRYSKLVLFFFHGTTEGLGVPELIPTDYGSIRVIRRGTVTEPQAVRGVAFVEYQSVSRSQMCLL
jgi:hypothetical protein